jgi:hypothetical protein
VLAALPTMTRFSRTSLLCGTLREGAQADEKREFARITGGRVFHKDDLRAPAGEAVNPTVREAIASSEPILGVVLNTVDDTLAKHDPDGTRWSVEAIQHLAPLLEVARQHGRIVVITSDHGHVVERGGRSAPRELADTRWRPASTGPAGPDEVRLAGPRVLAGGGAVVAPWVEDLRYGSKAAGYHGGASAAEVTIPLLVFAGLGVDLARVGWTSVGNQLPRWWDEPVAVARRPVKASTRARSKAPSPLDTDALFSAAPPVAAAEARPVPGTHDLEIDACLRSAVYQRARAAAGRQTLPDETVRQVLRLLLAGCGRAPVDAVARVLGVSPQRVNGPLSAFRKLLNVEGYPVVAMDADKRTLRLDLHLWRTQFELGSR